MKEPDHFNITSSFIRWTTAAVLLYVFVITFFPIPKENQRFVDIALAFMLGWISSNSSYLTGGNPQQRKTTPDGTTTADISATITTSEKSNETN